MKMRALSGTVLPPNSRQRRCTLCAPSHTLLQEREAILQVHARQQRMAPGIDYGSIARATGGFSGRDIEHLLGEAGEWGAASRPGAG